MKPKITVIINFKNKNNLILATEINDYLRQQGAQLIIPDNAPGYKTTDCQNIDFSGVEAAVVLGGDGTILTAARFMHRFDVPMLGVNMGQLGFLSEVEVDELYPALDKLLLKDYQIEERMMLTASVIRDGRLVADFAALNDLVINNSAFTRTISINLRLNGCQVRSSRSDGIIIATPTGSTAYSFSAGGPIVEPTMELMLINFVCPHSFVDRPMVVKPNSHIEVMLSGESEGAKLTADGQAAFSLVQGDIISICRANKNSRLIRFTPSNFFHRVESKLTK